MLKFNKVYFPGLISLVCLPLIVIFFLINNSKGHNYHALTLAWITRSQLNKMMSYPNKKLDIETLRKYQFLSLNGNFKKDSITLIKLKARLETISFNTDTVNGVKVTLGNHAVYQELVDVLDICLEADKRDDLAIIPINNNIYVVHMALQTKTDTTKVMPL